MSRLDDGFVFVVIWFLYLVAIFSQCVPILGSFSCDWRNSPFLFLLSPPPILSSSISIRSRNILGPLWVVPLLVCFFGMLFSFIWSSSILLSWYLITVSLAH